MTLKKINKILWWVIGFFGILSFIILLFTVFNDTYFNTSFKIEPKLASSFGDFFGGFIGTMFTVISILLILVTFIQQNIENRKKQTESNFFKLLDYHNENVRQLNIPHINPDKKDENKGRRAFVIFKLQLIELFKVVKKIVEELDLNLSKEDIADIVYISFYYGIDKDWEEFSKKKLSRYQIGNKVIKKLLEAKANNKQAIGRTNQTYLSSYFRNMYNAVKLIDADTYLSIEEKKQFLKILRAQLSNPELYVFFFNIISRFGKKWEEKKFITTYKLIKNIPLDFLGEDYNPKDYFQMEYEEDELN